MKEQKRIQKGLITKSLFSLSNGFQWHVPSLFR
uniref:Translation initiation factor 1 n=1 Tax=Drypetes lateriflora TaxID=212297 RepID=A0A7G8QD61_9ROSI|nr:translation initiation factor 1 [Drypetes lateriflora]QNK04719.1 translation initiation factor 1 [Drypetes lateriflora]